MKGKGWGVGGAEREVREAASTDGDRERLGLQRKTKKETQPWLRGDKEEITHTHARTRVRKKTEVQIRNVKKRDRWRRRRWRKDVGQRQHLCERK